MLIDASAEPRGLQSAAQSGPSNVRPQTITQIAFEELLGGFIVRYDIRMHVVHVGNLKEIFIEAMSEVYVATQAPLDRIDAEFYHGELRHCLRVSDVIEYT